MRNLIRTAVSLIWKALTLLCGSEEQENFDSEQRGQQKYVTTAVKAARDEANRCAKKRSKLLEESQAAWKRGDKKKAKELSDEGKKWGTKMESANQKAADLILSPQNVNITGQIDLHGLYLKEAMEATEHFLHHWTGPWAPKNLDDVLIITGAGHHSKTKDLPVIFPKVESLLREKRLAYKPTHGHGAFLVYLKPPQ